MGGDDFDHRLFCYLLEQNDLSKLNEQDSQLLLSLVRSAKEKLTTQTEAVIETTLSDGHKIHTVITRQEFHNLTQNLVQKTIEPVKQALKDAGVTKADRQGRDYGWRLYPHVARSTSSCHILRTNPAEQSQS